jgi:RNA polymerase sigma-70 factor (ECF subfamily)
MLLLMLMLPTEPVPGRQEDLEGLFRQLYGPVLSFFARQGCAPDLSQDLAQETLLRAFKSLEQFRSEAKTSTWVLTIATNLWRSRFRDAKAAKRDGQEVSISHQGPSLPFSEDRPLRSTLDVERRRLLRQAIESLPPRMRQCVLLRIYQDKSYREIAEFLEVSEQTAKSQVSMAKARLRSSLAEHYPELGPEGMNRRA